MGRDLWRLFTLTTSRSAGDCIQMVLSIPKEGDYMTSLGNLHSTSFLALRKIQEITTISYISICASCPFTRHD